MSKCILIADDVAIIRHRLRELFEAQPGFEVCAEADNGQDAIQKAQHLQPDLIVLDLSMPVMSGLEAARILRQIMPTVPIILFTMFSGEFTQEAARSAGIAAVVSKSKPATALVDKAKALLN